MIISHRHRFIFLKTTKAASSSMEIALSSLLGEQDVLTPAKPDIAEERAIPGQNFRIEHPQKPNRPLWRQLLGRPERYYHPSVGYYEHMPAWRVRLYAGEEVWNSYYKFAFTRNPWDRQVSFYYFKTRKEKNRQSFKQFMSSRRRAFAPSWDIYSTDGEIAVDFVGRYENLNEDFEKVLREIGLDGALELPKANASAKRTLSYRDHYDEKTRSIVQSWHSEEIEKLGYQF